MTYTIKHSHLAPALAVAALVASMAIGSASAQEAQPTSLTQDSTCQAIMQAGIRGAQGRVQADDEAIRPPQSTKTLTCLRSFFSGEGLDVLVSLPNPLEMADRFLSQICEAASSMWRAHASASAQCGLAIRGVNLGGFGFGGLGGGTYCPAMEIGGNGPVLGSASGYAAAQSGQSGTSVTVNGATSTYRPATAAPQPTAPQSNDSPLSALRNLFR